MKNTKNFNYLLFIQSVLIAFLIILISLITNMIFANSLIATLVLLILIFFIVFIYTITINSTQLKNVQAPLIELKNAFNQLTHGNLSYRIDEENNQDIKLTRNFNEMAKSLELSIKTIEKNQKDLETIIERRTKNLNDTNLQLHETMEKLKKSQLNRLQSEKQKSLSAIVSGFAHEINNPLTGIIGHLDLIELKNNIPDYAKEKHLSIRKQALRIKSIVKELNLLNPGPDHTKLDINLLNFFEKFIKVFNKKHIYINIECSINDINKSLMIHANHFSIWLVFEGICENALEAIDGNNIINGEIKIELSESKDKKYVIINVSDNGGGFDDIEKVFDPFYTTKSRTKKKGIGLSIAYNMINEHSGIIEASNNDKGGTITIKLPIKLS